MQVKKQKFRDVEFDVVRGKTHPDASFHYFELEENDFRNTYWNIKPGEVVFDVGAAYGSYALTACAVGAKVYCFEPEPTVFEDLQTNIKINNWEQKCFAYNVGLWSEDKQMSMKDYAPHWPQFTISEDYKMKTLDMIVSESGITKMDWLKVDVEGAEEHVIKGGLNSIKKFKPKLIIECHVFLNPGLTSKVRNLLPEYQFMEIAREPCIMLLGR